ncbi:hypothetical protein FGB62_347g06 [Gracilaria domingensis]|nr:hypothetical protein FGB62_347g06 [Gracilaria domingensis]
MPSPPPPPSPAPSPRCAPRAAFAAPASAWRGLAAPPSQRAAAALAPRRARLPAAPPRRRPRRVPARAVFIWSDAFGDDEPQGEHDDSDDNDAGGAPHDDAGPDYDLFDATGEPWGRAQRSVDRADFARLQSDDEQPPPHGAQPPHHADRDDRNPLFVAVRRNTAGPHDLDRLRQLASEGAAATFRDVVVGVLGNMPSDVYDVIITTDRSGMSRLMHSSLSTGYALRNAEFRMLLNENMNSSRSQHDRRRHDTSAVRDLFAAEPSYMHSVPRRAKFDTSRVSGVVRWWDVEREAKQELTASEYVAKLEAENELLRERLTAAQLNGANRNKLMAFVRTLTPQKLTELQAHLSEDVVEAFKSLVKSVLGELNVSKVQTTYSTTRDYMAQLTFWCLLVGYNLRNIEKRMEMTKIFENTEAYAESALSDADN